MDQDQKFRPKIRGWRGWLVNDGDCICACVRTWWGRGFALNRSDHQIITFSSLSSDQPCDEQDFQWWSYNSLFWPPSCLFNEQCSSLSPWCQCSMSFDLSLLLITNVSPSVGNNKSPFDIFAVYGSWTFNPPSQDDIDEGQLIIWAAASSPITHTTTWCLGPLAPSECEGHSHQRGSTLVSPPSPSSYLFLLSTFSSERHIVYLFVCIS